MSDIALTDILLAYMDITYIRLQELSEFAFHPISNVPKLDLMHGTAILYTILKNNRDRINMKTKANFSYRLAQLYPSTEISFGMLIIKANSSSRI